MENFTRRWKWSISILVIGCFCLYSCSDVAKIDDLKDSQESFDRNAPINFSGSVIDPITCFPVRGATVTSGQTTVITDSDGNFQSSVEPTELGSSITVAKEGHISYTFTADYDGFTGGIRVDLPARQNCVWIGPDEGAWYKVTTYDGCLTYTIDILGGSVTEWTEVCIGPGGNAYGAGIDGFYAQPAISIETPGNKEVEFLKDIDVRYDVRELLDVANKSACLADGSSLAVSGLSDLTSIDDILSVIFGSDNSVTVDRGRLITLTSDSGTLIPGVGLVTIVDGEYVVFPILPDGRFGPAITLGSGGTLPGQPHTSVADGEG